MIEEALVPRHWTAATQPPIRVQRAVERALGKSYEGRDSLVFRPEAPFPDSPELVTYFVQAATGGPVKIGRSTWSSLARRLQELQVGSPYPLCLHLVVEGNYEGTLHYYFRDLRLSGEWFHPGGDLALICGIPNDGTGTQNEAQIAYNLGRQEGYNQGRESVLAAPPDATYLSVGTTELRRRAAEGDQRAIAEMARAA